jgi:pimeloyl-ACP methyl ester carboxylesterase
MISAVVMDKASTSGKASFVLIPGAGGMAWYWHRVVPFLEAANREAITFDLPADNANAGLKDYTGIVLGEIGQRRNVILVAQSLGGFTAPLVCARASVGMLVFVNAMIPSPGETAGAWWGNTGASEARVEAAKENGYGVAFDLPTYFLHDVPAAVLRSGPPSQRDQSERVFAEPCEFEHWPEIPIHVIASADDRFFPLAFQRRVARERLKTDLEVIPGGHLVALSNPQGLAERLLQLGREFH